MTRNALFLPCLLSFLLTPVLAQPDPLVDLDEYVEASRAAWEIPGLAIAIVKDGQLAYAKGYGVRELGEEGAVDADTVFAVASNTKAFTAALLGMLVDEGKLRWDDRVVEHLPSFGLSDPWVTRDMRVRDLLCHRSGLPTFGGDHLWIGDCVPSAEILARLRYLEPTAPFRTRFQYQNLMFLVAGEVAARVSGDPWSTLMQERILRPLGMSRSVTSIHELEPLEPNVATPHERVDGEVSVISFDDVDCIAPAGALNASVRDTAQWMLLHLGLGAWGESRLLSDAVVREMQSVHTPIAVSPDRTERFGMNFSGYGLGWGLSDYHGLKLVRHGGGLSGMSSLQTLVPELDLGIFIATNFAPSSLTAALTYRILDAYLGRPERDWSAELLAVQEEQEEQARQREAELEEKRVKGTSPSGPPRDFIGAYESPLSGEAHVALMNGELYFGYKRRHRGPLEHWHYDTYRVHWENPIYDMPAKGFLTFERDRTGKVVRLTVEFYGPNVFERTER